MASYKIKGGIALKGEVIPQGAKNEALQILCAVLLTDEEVTIHNVPDILDVQRLISILQDLGVRVGKKGKGSYVFQANDINTEYLWSQEFVKKGSSIRGSVMLVGPILARYGKAAIPKPGGDKIGRRRLDTHFRGLEALGSFCTYDRKERVYTIAAEQLKGTYILLEEASVTGTANILMAAVLSPGNTTIYNAACEPYIQQLCRLLVSMGAKISGIGSNMLEIEGVSQLSGCTHTILPDMIEIGSWIGLAAMTQSEITIKNVGWDHLGVIPNVFRKLGLDLQKKGEDLYLPPQKEYAIRPVSDGGILTVSDAPWPGFTPDLLSIVLVVATQSKGSVLIHQKMFESRLFFTDKLIDMGAQIILCDPHRATVIGLNRKSLLKPTTMSSPDIRAGISLLIAALSAPGESTIHNIEQIDRGYENIVERLQALGADITRVEG